MIIFPPGNDHVIEINGVKIFISHDNDVTISNVRFLELAGERVFLGASKDEETKAKIAAIKERYLKGEPEPIPDLPFDHINKTDREILEGILKKQEPLTAEEQLEVKRILQEANSGCAT